MRTISIIPAMILVSLTACESAEEKARESAEAEQKAAKAAEDVHEEINDARLNAAEEINEIASEGAQEIGEATDEAEEKAADANAALAKERAAIREDAEDRLHKLERTAVDLRTELQQELPKKEFDTVQAEFRAKEQAVKESVEEIDRTDAPYLANVKKIVDERLDAYEGAIKDAKGRI